jgi:hypothetical protein
LNGEVSGVDVDPCVSVRQLGRRPTRLITLELAHGKAIAGRRAGGNGLA